MKEKKIRRTRLQECALVCMAILYIHTYANMCMCCVRVYPYPLLYIKLDCLCDFRIRQRMHVSMLYRSLFLQCIETIRVRIQPSVSAAYSINRVNRTTTLRSCICHANVFAFYVAYYCVRVCICDVFIFCFVSPYLSFFTFIAAPYVLLLLRLCFSHALAWFGASITLVLLSFGAVSLSLLLPPNFSRPIHRNREEKIKKTTTTEERDRC